MQQELIYGLHSVTTAVQRQPETVKTIWIDQKRRDARLDKLIHLAQDSEIELLRVPREDLDKMAPGTNHQGAIARCRPLVQHSEHDLPQLLEKLTEPPFVLILDGVQDPHNLGACLRSADAAGVQVVIAPKDRAVSITPIVRKVASGAAEYIPYVQVTNLARTLRMLQEQGIWLIGTADQAGQSLYTADLTGPIGIVMGGEGKGLRRLTKEHCDLLVSLPMAGVVESLNVSVATGICLYEAVRQRTAKI
jgi:23S rRNA (guanosine2251-2'-O)-methyltransferase